MSLQDQENLISDNSNLQFQEYRQPVDSVDKEMWETRHKWFMKMLDSWGSDPLWQPVVSTIKNQYQGTIQAHFKESSSDEELKRKLLVTLRGAISAVTRMEQRPEVSQWLEQQVDQFLSKSRAQLADLQSRKAQSASPVLSPPVRAALGGASAVVAATATMPVGAVFAQEQPPTASTSEINLDQSNLVEASNQQAIAVAQGFAEFEQLQQYLLEQGVTDLPAGVLAPTTLLNAAELPQVCQVVTGVDEGKPGAASSNFIDLSRPAINPASGEDAYLAPSDPHKDFARLDAPPSAYGVQTDHITVAFQISSRNALAGNGGFTAYVIAENEQGEQVFEYSDMYALQAVPEGRWNVLPVDFNLPVEQRVVGGGVVVVLENGQVIMIDDMNIFQDSSEGCLITLYLPDIVGYKDPTLDKESPYYGWFKVPATPEQHQFLTNSLKMPADKIVELGGFWLYNPKEVSVRLQTEQGELRLELSSPEDADLLRSDLRLMAELFPTSTAPLFVFVPRLTDLAGPIDWGQVMKTAGEGAIIRLGGKGVNLAKLALSAPGALVLGLGNISMLLGSSGNYEYAGLSNRVMFTRGHVFPISLPEEGDIQDLLSSDRMLVPVMVADLSPEKQQAILRDDWQLEIHLGSRNSSDDQAALHAVLLVDPSVGQQYAEGLLSSFPKSLDEMIENENGLPTIFESTLGIRDERHDVTFMLPSFDYREIEKFLIEAYAGNKELAAREYSTILDGHNEESTYLTPDGKERWPKNPPELGRDVEIGHDIFVGNVGLNLLEKVMNNRLARGDEERAKQAAQELLDGVEGRVRPDEDAYQRQLDNERQQVDTLKQKGNLTAEEEKLLEILEKHLEEATKFLEEERAKTQSFSDAARRVLPPPEE